AGVGHAHLGCVTSPTARVTRGAVASVRRYRRGQHQRRCCQGDQREARADCRPHETVLIGGVPGVTLTTGAAAATRNELSGASPNDCMKWVSKCDERVAVQTRPRVADV